MNAGVNIRDWKLDLSVISHRHFSPSGHAMAFQPLMNLPLMSRIAVHFADGREPAVYQYGNGDEDDHTMIIPRTWASDDELIYYHSGQPMGPNPKASLRAFSVSTGQTRLALEYDETMSIAYSGEANHLSILAEPEGKPGLFDLDVRTGAMVCRTEFDAALAGLKVYPLFEHSFCYARQEAAVIGWPTVDFLPDGVQATEENSHWSPILDTPWIQNYVSTRPDGTKVTQRQLTAESKRKTPPRLFLLDASGNRLEVPGANHATHPIYSPDGTVLSFERFDRSDPQHPYRSLYSVWMVQRADLSLMRLGGCPMNHSALMHPAGVLFCNLDDESIPANIDRRARAKARQWRAFDVRNGEVRPARD